MSDPFIVKDRPGRDDPIWEYLLETRLRPYIPRIREWWANIEELAVSDTGIEQLDGPPGLFQRFTRTSIRSPIRGVQAFPFIETAYLQITNVQGGSVKMIDHVCSKGFTIDEFTIVCKTNLTSIFNGGQIIAIIPTDIMNGTHELGKWIYLKQEEMIDVSRGIVPEAVKNKLLLKI